MGRPPPRRNGRERPGRPVSSIEQACNPTERLPFLQALAGLLLSLLVDFRSYLPDLNLVPGDLGDTRLVVFILEHWFSVFRGQESFFALQMFHPDPRPLAYADGLFLFGIPYSALRALGLDYFTSYQLLAVLLTAVGYAAWLALLMRGLRLRAGFAILGAVLLTSMNALQVQADIFKLTAVHLFPILLWLLWMSVSKMGLGAIPGAVGFAAGLGLLFFTSYYPAWFLVLTLAVFGLLSFAFAAAAYGPRAALDSAWVLGWARRRAILAGILALGISLVPFAITYGPLVREGSFRGFDLVLEFSPTLRDVVNVSPLNYVWSPLLQALGFKFGSIEAQMGSPLLVLLTSGLAVFALTWRIHTSGWRKALPRDRFLVMLAATGVVIVLASIKFGDFSLWYPVYKLVPGATAVRALGRILLMMDMIVIVIAMWALQELWLWLMESGSLSPTVQRACFAALAIVLIAEQVNRTAFRLEKAGQLTFMQRYRAPESFCSAFFINDAETDDLPFGYYNLDAMMIGMHLGIPTVNGYSGFEPHPAFTLIPRGPEYTYRILDWLRLTQAKADICELDYRSREFRRVDVDAEFIRARGDFRASLLETYSSLYAAAGKFVAANEDLANFDPEYLQAHGYLDPSLGHGSGTRYRWIQDRYWIGPRACGNRQCVGIGITGEFGDLRWIFHTYGPLALRIHFPNPDIMTMPPPENTRGEALLIFRPEILQH